MSFALLSTAAVVGGIALLAIGLWFAQRLRVVHREVEVISVLFWQQALEETRARVFVRRFRHWWAWALLVLIAALLWLLAATPQTHSLDGTRHLVVVDWGISDAQRRQQDLALALDLAAGFPTGDREVIAVSTQLETLLRANESIDLAWRRAATPVDPAPRDLGWAIEALAARATSDTPIRIHIIGDTPIDRVHLSAVRSHFGTDASGRPILEVVRVDREPSADEPMLATLGMSESLTSNWEAVDVWIAPDDASTQEELAVTINGTPLDHDVTRRSNGAYELIGLPARGGEIAVGLSGRQVGGLTLPNRRRIRVRLDPAVPASLRRLISLDPACEIVDAQVDVVIGFEPDAEFRLVADDAPAFSISESASDPQAALTELVDQLALKQIDATGLAEASGRVIEVQFSQGNRRQITVWETLFTPAFDFQESRACPVFVARAVRWLADRPAMISYAELGRRLPESSPRFGRSLQTQVTAADGRTVTASRLAVVRDQPATLDTGSVAAWPATVHPLSWIGLLVAILLIGEWILVRRGQIP